MYCHYDSKVPRNAYANQVVTEVTKKNLQHKELIINVKDFGATGDGTTDDTNSIQTAINSAKEGQIVYFPCAKYVIGSICLKSGITYDFGNSELICMSDTPITATGIIKTVTTIKNYKAFNKTVSLGSVAEAERNDILHLIAYDDPFNRFREYYHKGGTTPILAKNEKKSFVEISEPFMFDIKAEKTIAKVVSPWRGVIRNIKGAAFKRKNTLNYFIQIEYGYMAKIENIDCSMEDGHNIINLKCCCLCSVENCNLFKSRNHDIGYSYNILFCACTRCSIKNCNMKTMWHCYTNGGKDGCTVGTVIDNCSMLTDGRVPAFTEHNNGINTCIYNSTLEGFTLSCGALVKNCILIEPHNFPPSNGTCFQFNAQHQNWFFNNYTIEDCTIHRTRNIADCVFVIKNADTTRNKTNKNRVYINNIKMIRCFASDKGPCKLLGNKRNNVEINQISIENCRNITAEFRDAKTGFDFGNSIKFVSLKDNLYKDKIASLKSNYVRNIVIDNCMIDNATDDSSVLDIYGAENVFLRNIKACGLPVTLTINIGAQNHEIKNLCVENVDAKPDPKSPSLKVKLSPEVIIQNAQITNCATDSFCGLNSVIHLSGNGSTYQNHEIKFSSAN